MRRLGLMVTIAGAGAIAGGTVAQAGPAYSLGRKAVCADAAVEVELHLARAVDRSSPSRVRSRAMARARVKATFYGTPAVDLPRPLQFYLPDQKWRQAEKQGRVRVILFAGRPKGTATFLSGVEGAPTDVDLDYAEVRSAVVRYAGWRARRDDPAVLAEAERTLATAANGSIGALTWTFLCSGGHRDAIARAVRAALPGSPAATMAKEGAACLPDLDCRDW